MEIKSTKPLTEEEKKVVETIRKSIVKAFSEKNIKYDFDNQEYNKKLEEWLMK